MSRICIIGLLVLIFCSCEQNTTTEKSKKDTFEEGITTGKIEEREKTITLTHDFGVLVQPVTESVHCEFEIKNDTQTTWNLKQVINTCSCTVTDITSPKIEPGKIEKIKVTYKPVGNESFNDIRKSFVIFTEDIAPQYVLYVKSKVREPMTVMPSSLSWMQVGENQTRNGNFEILNYSKEEWNKVSVTHKPDWLYFASKEVAPSRDDPKMRQRWFADIKIDTNGIIPREYRDEIILEVKEANLTKRIPTVLQIRSSVSAVPSQFFLGEIKRGTVTKKSIKILFNPDSIPKSKDEIHFEHNLGSLLSFDWLNTAGETWELQASIKLESFAILDDVNVIMTFDNPKLPKIVLPIYAFFTTEDKQ